MEFSNKKVLVLGLGKSGVSSALVLKGLGAKVWLSELQDNPSLREKALQLIREGFEVELGKHSHDFFESKDLIVISPGVPSDLSLLEEVRKKGVPVISEIELGYLLCPSPIIAITGTNGKTTTTTLVGRMLDRAGRKNVVCGNIGNPFTGELSRLTPETFVVLEASSFQLENIVSFRPYIGVVLNITPDHLDRHKTFANYVKAKEKIFLNQTESDYLILNYGDNLVRKFAEKARAKVIYFNYEEIEKRIDENQKAVLKVGSLLGIPEEIAYSVFKEFRGLPHRFEFVDEIEGVTFINDSKATNIHSTAYGLSSFDNKVILIAGGRDKGQDFNSLRSWIGDKVKYLALIGESKDKIAEALLGLLPIQKFESLKEAVEHCYSIAQKGDIIILSPMCASFDMFKDYEERGEVFKEIVKEINSEICVK